MLPIDFTPDLCHTDSMKTKDIYPMTQIEYNNHFERLYFYLKDSGQYPLEQQLIAEVEAILEAPHYYPEYF